MSLLQNGNDPHHQTSVFTIEDHSQVGEARRSALNFCQHLEFDEVKQGRVSIIVNELGTNLVKYASGGKLLIRFSEIMNTFGIEILSMDRGPGILNIADALTDGFSTGSSPGTGMGAVKRQSDEFDIYSEVGQGTLVYAAVYSKKNITEQIKYRVGAVCVPIDGESLCGDAWCVHQDGEQVSVLMADGLGHGPLAHAASVKAIKSFADHQHHANPDTLTAIHKHLQATRGAAVFLAEYADGQNIEHLGVGNIRAVIQSGLEMKSLITQNGTAGLTIPKLKSFGQLWDGQGSLIFHSDGINTKWDLTKYPGLLSCHPAIIAAVIYRDFCRMTDDATVVVVGRKR